MDERIIPVPAWLAEEIVSDLEELRQRRIGSGHTNEPLEN